MLASAVQPRDRVYVYICPLPPEPASHAPPPGHRRARSRAPGAVPQIPAGRLVHTRESGSVSAALSPPLLHLPMSTAFLYLCVSVPALQRGSSGPFF